MRLNDWQHGLSINSALNKNTYQQCIDTNKWCYLSLPCLYRLKCGKNGGDSWKVKLIIDIPDEQKLSSKIQNQWKKIHFDLIEQSFYYHMNISYVTTPGFFFMTRM